jgi:phospholipid/cholesterol/gamma-HCH transport system permease protein
MDRDNLPEPTSATPPAFDFINPAEGVLQLNLAGNWLASEKLPSPNQFLAYIEHDSSLQQLQFNTEHLLNWDRSLLTFLLQLILLGEKHQIHIDKQGLPPSIVHTLQLAKKFSHPEARNKKDERAIPFFDFVGNVILHVISTGDQLLIFLGEFYRSCVRCLLKPSSFPWREFFGLIQETGLYSLFMIGAMSFLVGIIFSFVEAIQLKIISAQLFLANVIAVSIVRELSPLMVGIFMAGRTGAAYAANLGMMQINNEVEALEIAGHSAYDWLVLPRVIALTFVMPLLYVYSVLCAILGSASIDTGLLGQSMQEYLVRALHSINLSDLELGLLKTTTFGFILAISGCFYGMHAKTSQLSVGDAARNSVVMGVVFMIIVDALLAWTFSSVSW